MDLESIAIRLSRSENLPALPQAVNAVIKLADDPNASPKALERILEGDTALTAKLLRVANSTYYGGNQVPSVGRAIRVLGLNTVKSMVLALTMQSTMTSRSQVPSFNKSAYWQHCLATATAARIIGKLALPLQAEELYSAAMLHDIGLIVLERYCPENLDNAIRYAQQHGVPLHEAERKVYGYDHTEVGALLADKWSLSVQLRHAIRYHHDVASDPEGMPSTHVISAANTLAYQCGFAILKTEATRDCAFDPMVALTVDMPEDQLEIIRTVLQQEVKRAQEGLNLKAA